MPVVLCSLYYIYVCYIRIVIPCYKILVISHLINPLLVTLCLLCCIYYIYRYMFVVLYLLYTFCGCFTCTMLFILCFFLHCACYIVLFILCFCYTVFMNLSLPLCLIKGWFVVELILSPSSVCL